MVEIVTLSAQYRVVYVTDTVEIVQSFRFTSLGGLNLVTLAFFFSLTDLARWQIWTLAQKPETA